MEVGQDRPELWVAVERLTRAVLDNLAGREGTPAIGPAQDLRHWRRFTQTSFVALQTGAWHMPNGVSTVGWLDTFPEMADVRKLISADSALGSRVDNQVGPEFSRRFRRLDWLLVQQLIEPMVRATRSYRFDDTVFDSYYRRLTAGLLADEVLMVEFVPLNAFTSSLQGVRLTDGLTLRPLTNLQMSAAIRVQGVPGEFGVGPNAFEVSWLNQWGLVTEQSFPLRTGPLERTTAAPFPSLQEPANRLVQALRIVCGGSAIATRPILIQHEDDFPADLGESALRAPIGVADLDRPTYLGSDSDVDEVREVYRLLDEPAVRDDRALQTALRRLMASGSRNLVQDRLIDLMTSAEALFIKRAGITGQGKGHHIAIGASTLLNDDPILATDSGRIYEFMRLAYQLRNDEIHGDDSTERALTGLNGSEVNRLDEVVADIEQVMRRATHLVLRDVASTSTETTTT